MRISSIDTFKGLAILAVIIIHTEPFLAIEVIKKDWSYLGQSLQKICSFAVPFFFVTAGYFFFQGIQGNGLYKRWRDYTKRLIVLLLIWIIIDGIFWGRWLEQLITAKSFAPLLWNLNAIPSFALKRPDLFVFRGTAVPLWFLFSLITSISVLVFCIKLSLRPIVILLISFCLYIVALMTSSYSGTMLGIGFNLPLEQRGPLIAFLFLTIGYYFSVHERLLRYGALFCLIALLLMFVESISLSYFAGNSFQERPYLFSTIILASALLLFSIQNPSFGATTLFPKMGKRSLGIYLVHTPVLGAIGQLRDLMVNPIWELLFPILVLAISYTIVNVLMKIPYVRILVL